MFESLSSLCVKMSCWKGFRYAEDAGKAKNVQVLEDFSEEQCLTAQDKQGTHEQSSQT